MRGQPRILPLSQDYKILQRASTIGLTGAFAVNSLIMNARTCDDLQCSTLMIEIQDYFTKQIKTLYNDMPEDEQKSVENILSEVGSMAIADFMSKTFGEFVTGRVTDSREFITTLILLENNDCLKGKHIDALKNSLLRFIGSMETMESRDMLKGLQSTDLKNIIGCKIEELKGSFKRLENSGKLAIMALKSRVADNKHEAKGLKKKSILV